MIKDKIIEYFNSLNEVKRLKELEPYIDSNIEIKNRLEELLNLQKEIVNLKEYHINKQYEIKKEEYELKKEELLNIPFVEEYLELLEYVDNLLTNFSADIEDEIDKLIN